MNNQRALQDFAEATAAYPVSMSASLTYIALTAGLRREVVKARLNLHGEGMEIHPKLFISDEVTAARFAIADLGLSADDVINGVLEGKVSTPQGEYKLLPQLSGGFAANYIPLHPEVLAQHTRTGVLQVRGTDQSGHWQNPLLDWSLRSAEVPYDTLNELSLDFGLGAIVEPSAIFEAVAGSIVALDFDGQVDGDVATIGVRAIKGLNRSKISVGYRTLDKNEVVARGSVSGDNLTWTEEDATDIGSTTISVPPASLVNCYARYEGTTYHSGFVVDPRVAQNPRRSAYERFDPELKDMIELLSMKERRRSRELEPAVASLLWMLGFNPCHLGGMKQLEDGPDIIATTPAGHLIVVECTIGMLKAESKMPKLLARAVTVREQLARSGHGHLRVLPVMVTTLSAEEINSEINDAVSNGVYVLTSDDFQEAIGRTLFPPNAEQLFDEAVQRLQAEA